MVVIYSLEFHAIAVNVDKCKYVLLNDYELQHCANLCNLFAKLSPIYLSN